MVRSPLAGRSRAAALRASGVGVPPSAESCVVAALSWSLLSVATGTNSRPPSPQLPLKLRSPAAWPGASASIPARSASFACESGDPDIEPEVSTTNNTLDCRDVDSCACATGAEIVATATSRLSRAITIFRRCPEANLLCQRARR